jgi:hypothetical protein
MLTNVDPMWALRKNIEFKMNQATEAYRQICLVYEECYRTLWEYEDGLNSYMEMEND